MTSSRPARGTRCGGHRHARGLAAAAAVVAMTGCAEGPEPLRVFAAASLTDAFDAIAAEWAADQPELEVRMTYAGSQVLRVQIEQGAPADVFASANEAHFEALVADGVLESGLVFARNALALVVPVDNPAGIVSLRDLPSAERLVVGASTVPIGAYTRAMLTRAEAAYGAGFSERVAARIVSEETNARLVRTKVEVGEADAAIVYRSDAVGASGVRVIPLPDHLQVSARYPIGAVQGANRAAAMFIEHVLSAAGGRVLAAHGLTPGAE